MLQSASDIDNEELDEKQRLKNKKNIIAKKSDMSEGIVTIQP